MNIIQDPNVQYAVYLLLRCLTITFSMFFFFRKRYIGKSGDKTPYLLLLIMLYMCINIPAGDYWTYKYWFENSDKFTHLEQIWNVLREAIPESYELFRGIVWGTGLLAFVGIVKLSKSNMTVCLVLFATFYIMTFGYARSAIAYMLISLAYIMYIQDRPLLKNNLFNNLLILALLATGVLMHRSMLILILLLVISERVRIRRNSISALIIGFPIIVVILKFAFLPVSHFLLSSADDINEMAQNYLQEENTGLWKFFVEILHNLPLLVLYGFSLKSSMLSDNQQIKKMANASFLIIYAAFVMFFTFSGNSLIFFYRTLYMAHPLMLILIAKEITSKRDMKLPLVMAFVVEIYYLYNSIMTFMNDPMYIINQMNDRYLYY